MGFMSSQMYILVDANLEKGGGGGMGKMTEDDKEGGGGGVILGQSLADVIL